MLTVIEVMLAAVFVAGLANESQSLSPAAHTPDTHTEHIETSATESLDDLSFLCGSWSASYDTAHVEEWFGPSRNDSMLGMFRWMSDGSTDFTEHIVLEQREDGVHMFIRHFSSGLTPWEMEADGPTHFVLSSLDDGRAEFRNTDSESLFPSSITYHRTQPDVLVARLDGRAADGEARSMEFTYRSTPLSTSTTTADTLTPAGQAMGYNAGLTIAMHVSDLAKSIDWYQDVVGFKLLYHLEEMGWCELTTGVPGVAIGLSQVEEPKTAGPVPTFGVNDIDTARGLLEEKGVRFDGPTQEIPGMVKLATFFDPDGNALMLYQALSDEMPQ